MADHLRPVNWTPTCCAVTQPKLVCMVVFGRIQRTLYAADVVPDHMSGTVVGRSTQEATFLYDMYVDDEDLEAFMASMDMKRAFLNTPHRLLEEVSSNWGSRTANSLGRMCALEGTASPQGKGCTEWVTPGSGVRQGRVEGPFLYMPAMFLLMRWIAQKYAKLARTPHKSPAHAYPDDAVPRACNDSAQKVVQDLMQKYGRDNHLVCCTEKTAILRRGGDGNALDVGDGMAWLERAEEDVVLGHVKAMGAGGIRLPDKLLRAFRAMFVVLGHHPPSVQTTLYCTLYCTWGCTSCTGGDSSRR